MLRNLASSLFLTERDPDYYEDLMQADGKTPVNPPKYPGRVVTTLHKAKEVRPLVEKCITLAKKALPHLDAAADFETQEDRNSDGWRQWRESEQGQQWNAHLQIYKFYSRHINRQQSIQVDLVFLLKVDRPL